MTDSLRGVVGLGDDEQFPDAICAFFRSVPQQGHRGDFEMFDAYKTQGFQAGAVRYDQLLVPFPRTQSAEEPGNQSMEAARKGKTRSLQQKT